MIRTSRWRWACGALFILGCGGPPASEDEDAALIVDHRGEADVAWDVPYGEEFWHPSVSSSSSASDPLNASLSEAMERVSSAFRAGEEGVEARQAGYRARVEGSALRFEARTPGQTPAAVTLKTRAIVAGPERLFDERGAALLPRRVRGNTAQLLLEEELGLVEHVEARGRGVEITWVLSSPPPDGDLRVELSVVGLTHAGEDEHGLRFADANGDVRVRMSDAVLVDSSGRRWPAESEVTTFGVRITAKAEHLAQARYPVALDPTFTAEVGVGEPEYQRADGGQHDVTIAHNGHHYLICWVDTRQFSNVTELYCARFTSAGELLDPAGIDVSPTTGSWIASIPLCSSTLARATRA